MLGIENLKKVFGLLAALANLGDDVGRDTSSARWGKLLGLIPVLGQVASLDIKAALAEFKDLDAVEKQALLAEIQADLNLADDKLEAAIEDGLAIIVDLESVVERSIGFVKNLKA
jgi:hypothetical protein